MPCTHPSTSVYSGKTYCDNCGACLTGRVGTVNASVLSRPMGRRILNIHGHGVRRGPSQCGFPGNVEVAFWVPDGALLNASTMTLDATDGTPADAALVVEQAGTFNYSTFALGGDDDRNTPPFGTRVRGNLIEAVAAAAAHGAAAWIVNTPRITGQPSGTGVITLSYICATIGQVTGAGQYQWRINWVCCREALA